MPAATNSRPSKIATMRDPFAENQLVTPEVALLTPELTALETALPTAATGPEMGLAMLSRELSGLSESSCIYAASEK
jgi:hypothetical protein